MLILLLLSLLGVSQAQHYCCVPSQYEANLGQLEGYYQPQSHQSGIIQGVDALSYDVVNQRMVVRANLVADGKPLPPTTVHNDYIKKIQWTFTSSGCSKAALLTPMPKQCIPATANFTGSTYFGVGRDKLMLDIWTFTFPNTRISLTTTQNGCYPVSEGIVGEFGSITDILSQCKTGNCTDAVVAYGITGLTVGIKSQSVFDLPDSCKTPESHDPIEGFTVGHHVHEIRKRFA